MNKEVLEEGKKTEEGRLKIIQIRKLSAANSVYNALQIAGISSSLYINFLCLVSLFGKSFNLESEYSPFVLILLFIFANKMRKKFTRNIPVIKQENIEEIIRLEKEILNEEDTVKVR